MSHRMLILRMVLVALLTPLAVLALLAAAVIVLPESSVIAGIGVIVAIGVVTTIRERQRDANRALPSPSPELLATVQRLCALADVPEPKVAVEPESQPNSWVVHTPGRRAQLHVTRALLELLEPEELRAVLAHELSHLANHDAAVMTVVGMPGAVLLRGAARVPMIGLLWVTALLAGALGLLSRAGTSSLSRYRELVADEGACAITGHPSALASALLKVSGALDRLPSADLRAVAARDAFHLVAVERDPRGSRNRVARRLTATHPPLQRRLAALEEIERRAQRSPRN